MIRVTGPLIFGEIVMAKYDSYVICTSPRSGSTLLCKLLASTGIAGNPASYFHRPSISNWLQYFDLTPESSTPERSILDTIFKVAIAKGSLDTGIFGLRMQRHSFDFFTEKLATLHRELPTDLLRFHEVFGRTAFLHLTRLDKVEQAISYVKAEQTGLWHMATDGAELERLSSPQAPIYDPDRISVCVDEMKAYDHEWESWFAKENIDRLRITYESLAEQPIKSLIEILEHLGLDRDSASDVIPGVAKMADKTNRDWVLRFRSEYPEI